MTPSAATPCPNCRQPMASRDFERHDGGFVQVELCYPCGGIWFDHLASVELAPAAVIELFRDIRAHDEGARQAVASRLDCPRCAAALALSFDLSKAGRFSYFRCTRGDGRYTPFFQFLREKQFVRSLSAVEIARVRAEVRQVSCSACGGPIDLEHEVECPHCHAPVSFLDPQAVEKALAQWSEAEERRHLRPSGEATEGALRRVQFHPPAPGIAPDHAVHRLAQPDATQPGLDLVAAGIHAIARLFERHD